jgi:hypothetical protein
MDKITRLTELKKLLDDGLLTQEEFDNYKTELISVKSEENKFQQKNVVIETETTKVEENTIIENEAKTTDKQQDEKSQKEYVKKLNDTKTNHSYGRYILAIAFFLGGGFFIFYHFVLKEKWSNEESIMSNEASKANETNTRFTYLREPVDELESGSVTGIKSEQELYNYLDEVAKYWCSEFKKAKQFQNENKRFEEMLKVDRCINAFPLGFTEGVIMPNDLPMELSQKATNYFQNKVVELGFNYSWNEGANEDKQEVSNEEPEETYYWRSSDYNEEQFNREREESESESNQNYYKSSNEVKVEKEELYKTTIIRNPETRLDIANVFWKKNYTLFDKLTDEPIFPFKKGEKITYKIYCSSNESLTPEYVELSPEQLERKMAYKFANLENCNKWIESKKRKLKKN